MIGEIVTLINRTSRPLNVVQNGREIVLKPGKNPVTADWIRFAKQQHPRMGTFDPSGLDGDYLVAVEGHDPDEMCLPIPPGEEHRASERFDRRRMDVEGQSAQEVVTGVRPPQRRLPGDAGAIPLSTAFDGRN
jgi:hypothetical protein